MTTTSVSVKAKSHDYHIVQQILKMALGDGDAQFPMPEDDHLYSEAGFEAVVADLESLGETHVCDFLREAWKGTQGNGGKRPNLETLDKGAMRSAVSRLKRLFTMAQASERGLKLC